MKIGVIQASSQSQKNRLLYDAVKDAAKVHTVINYGCRPDDGKNYSYIEISIVIGKLIADGQVDFVVTGCSSGQGMALACNSIPGLLCGYAPTPRDAFLFAQINNGNVISLPLGEDYTWTGEENLRATLKALFSEPFGQGWPKSQAERKRADTLLLKKIRAQALLSFSDFTKKLREDKSLSPLLARADVFITDFCDNSAAAREN